MCLFCFVLFLVSYHCYNKLPQTSFVICESHSVVSDSLRPHGLYSPWNSPGQDTGVDIFSLLQGIFPTQGSNPGLSHCRQILYQLSHKGSPSMVNGNILNKIKESIQNEGDLGSIPGLGISPGEGKGYPLQYPGLENSMDYMIHGFAKSRT